MCAEPFNRPFAEVARMTDYQIIEILIKPAARRQEALERECKGLPPAAGTGAPERVPGREEMVHWLMVLGMSKADAIKEYERQKKMNEKAR